MKLIIVRHAETRWNIKALLQSLTDNSINSVGIKNAKKTAELLKNENIDIVFSSDLKRTIQTAKIINKFHDKKHKTTPLISERNFGKLEGIKYEEYQKLIKKIDDMNSHEEYEIENIEALKKRIQIFWKYLKKNHESETILIVSHGATIKMLLSVILNKPFKEVRKIVKKNTAYSIIEFDENNKVKKYNLAIDSHLD